MRTIKSSPGEVSYEKTDLASGLPVNREPGNFVESYLEAFVGSKNGFYVSKEHRKLILCL